MRPLPHLLIPFFLVFTIVSARALSITPIFDSSVTSATNAAQIEAAFNYAAQQYENLFSNPISFTIEVDAVAGTGTFGESQDEFNNVYTYSQVRTALMNDPTFNAITSLPSTDPTGGGTFLIADPEAMALGFSVPTGTNGIFYFGLGNNFNYSTTNRAIPGKFDFVGVAEHEISEIMGRSELLGVNLTGSADYEPYDMFRFTSNGVRSINETDSNVYFSLNNGATNLVKYNPPGNGDLQDWATTSPYTADAYNAFSQPEIENGITAVDMEAMEALGYTPAIPEPGDMAMLGGGLMLLAARIRRRKSGPAP